MQAGWGVPITDAEATFREMDGYGRCCFAGVSTVGAELTDSCVCIGLRILFGGAQEQGRADPVHRVLRLGYQAEAAEESRRRLHRCGYAGCRRGRRGRARRGALRHTLRSPGEGKGRRQRCHPERLQVLGQSLRSGWQSVLLLDWIGVTFSFFVAESGLGSFRSERASQTKHGETNSFISLIPTEMAIYLLPRWTRACTTFLGWR
jgi:hypothetical protein